MKYVPLINCIWWLIKNRKSKSFCIQQLEECLDDGWVVAGSTIGLIIIFLFVVITKAG